MVLARTAISAVTSWMAKHRGNGLERYCFELARDEDENMDVWTIHDRTAGLGKSLGVLHDPLLAQQVVDDLNRREIRNRPPVVKADD
jgi:hypothetical protein